MEYKVKYKSELYHHGILGQKWGKRNGPPYPLDAEDHSESEKKDGYKKSLKKLKLSDNQKRLLKVGAAIAVAGLATYGIYKVSQLGVNTQTAKDFDYDTFAPDTFKPDTFKPEGFLSGDINDISVLNSAETTSDAIKKANPLWNTPEGKNNCVPSALAGFCRTNPKMPIDATAKSTGGQQLNLAGVVEKCFKGARVIDGSAITFGKSRDDAASMLIRKFGQDASGFVSIQWKEDSYLGSGGHTFSWKISDGNVEFTDFNAGRSDSVVSKYYFNEINRDGRLILARVDNAEPDYDALSKYLEFRK